MNAMVRLTFPANALKFLAGGGEMGERIRDFDWADIRAGAARALAVGPAHLAAHPAHDPASGVHLLGRRAHLLLQRRLQPLARPGKTPVASSACPAQQAWPEIWHIIGPQIDQVMRGDAATWHENQLVPIIRHGELQDVYWTYSYGPIDEPAAPHGVGGVLVICTETTAADPDRTAHHRRARTLRAALRAGAHVHVRAARSAACFELANPGYMRLVGHRPIIGRPVAEALPESRRTGLSSTARPRFTPVVKPSWRSPLRISYQAKPGGSVEPRYLDFVYQPIKDADGSVSGIFVEGVDVTTRALADAALREADRRKDEFLAMLAHELRNPLAPIRTAAEVISRRVSDDETARRAAEVVRRQATQLTRIVDDLLDVSRISMGHIELQRETLLLSDVIDHAMETVAPLWRAKQHEISTASSLEPLYVSGDLARLVQSFGNVMTNAAKYTDAGGKIGIHVTATADCGERGDQRHRRGHLAGFHAAHLRPVRAGDRTLDRAQGGLGIGLSVVKKLVEMHGGTVSAPQRRTWTRRHVRVHAAARRRAPAGVSVTRAPPTCRRAAS